MKTRKQKIANTGRAIALFGAGILSALIGVGCRFPETQKPAFTGKATIICPKKENPIKRAELFLKKLPYNSDIFNVNEVRGGSRFSKVRLSTYPLHTNNFGVGAATRYISGSNSRSHHESSLSAYVKGKPTRESFAKLTGWYYPEVKDINWYGLINGKKFYADVLGAHNTKTRKTWIRPGIDYKLNKNLSVGIEGKLVGEGLHLKEDYYGLRIGFRF